MTPCTLGHGKDFSEEPAAFMFNAENSVDVIKMFLTCLPTTLHHVTVILVLIEAEIVMYEFILH